MCRMAGRRTLADNQTQVAGTVRLHYLVESNRFGFTISRRTRLGFSRGFPLFGEAVRY